MAAHAPQNNAVVLLSGGLDSTTILAVAAHRGQRIHALSFDYDQRHRAELTCAKRQATRYRAVDHQVVDLRPMGRVWATTSSLFQAHEHPVPKGRDPTQEDIPTTYVPARNTLFLAHALAWAEVLQARTIYIGVNALDYSGYPDCRPAFIEAFQRVADLGTRTGIEGRPIAIEAPLGMLRKHEIIALGIRLGVDYADTISCYDPRQDTLIPRACGDCDSCQLRHDGFVAAGVPDPTVYVEPT